MKISDLLTDDAILAELGTRVARCRLERQLTQADLAEQAGVSKRTVERIEAGASAQLPEAAPRPMDLLKRKGKARQRASSRRPSEGSNTPWSWDDET
jgi:DNA-binding XRE family transcriptional regulator